MCRPRKAWERRVFPPKRISPWTLTLYIDYIGYAAVYSALFDISLHYVKLAYKIFYKISFCGWTFIPLSNIMK